MTGHLHIAFSPLLSPSAIEGLAFAAILITGYALYKRARGGLLRGILFALLLLALLNPSVIAEQHEPLKDTALLVIDDSASMHVGDHGAMAAKAADAMTKKLAAFSDMDVETLHVKGAEETDLFGAVTEKLASIPRDRLAGIIAITDGEVHDKANAFTAPFHALIAGHKDEADRRISITQAPAYGIVGKSVTLTVRVDDTPKPLGALATVTFRRDDGQEQTINMPIGKDVKFDVPVAHPGANLYVLSTPGMPGELTEWNNTASASINGIRDRLRVLLISGEPHIGGRTWRNFLKSDPAVDLVHFTILRSPAKQDSVPNSELSLIAFPVRELFETKLKSFDLVIFDRFKNQSLISENYLENIAHYVEDGGSLLLSSATDEGIPVLTQSPLARILPAQPTGHLLTGSFVPDVTDEGERHPVTASLEATTPRKNWGPWFRQIEARADSGDVLMTGINEQPLLILSHAGNGRVAQFLSDQFWLWAHDYQGGGPSSDLLRRIAHWLVQEPDLDENAMRAHAETTDAGWNLIITKQSLHDDISPATITDPEGQISQIDLKTGKQPGVLSVTLPVTAAGLYHIKDVAQKNGQDILTWVGPANAPEFAAMNATDEKVADAAKASGGGIVWLDDRADGPDIHRTSAGAAQSGWGWIGLRQNNQYRVTGSKAFPLIPVVLMTALLLAAAMLAWRREGRS